MRRFILEKTLIECSLLNQGFSLPYIHLLPTSLERPKIETRKRQCITENEDEHTSE